MGDKDKTEKLFVGCRDVFAELVNVLIYQGAGPLEETAMLPGPTESVFPREGRGLHSQFQDYSMYDMGGGAPRALYTIENQGGVDRQMPLRCAGYEGAAYRRQYGHGDGRGIYPVISMVLNWGESRWDAAMSVRELLDHPVAPVAEEYLDRNRIHVFDMRFLDQAVREQFEGDARVVLDYLCDPAGMRLRNQRLRNPEEVMRMLHALSGDERYLSSIEYMKEGGGRKVCELLDEMVNKGIEQGIAQGIEQGIAQGIEQGIQILVATYKEFDVAYEAAAAGVKEKYGLDDAEVEKDMALYW